MKGLGGCRCAALSGLAGLAFARNPGFAEGLSTSLRAGVEALGEGVDGALVLLGDMPLVGPDLLDALMTAYEERPDAGALVPVWDGAWGNPVLIARPLFQAVGALLAFGLALRPDRKTGPPPSEGHGSGQDSVPREPAEPLAHAGLSD